MKILKHVVFNTVYFMFVCFTICNSIHNLPKVIKYSMENSVVCSISMGLQNVNKNVFHAFGNLVIWL